MEKMRRTRYIASWIYNHSQPSCRTRLYEHKSHEKFVAMFIICDTCNSSITTDMWRKE